MGEKYKARKGAKFNNKEAQVIGKTINNLRDKKGHITSKNVLDNARDKDSPLHKYFEWSNSKAGREFRLQQARDLVNHVVEIVIVQGEEIEQKSFFSVTVKNEGKVYVTLQDAIENESYRKQLLNNAIATLENLTITMKMFRDADYNK